MKTQLRLVTRTLVGGCLSLAVSAALAQTPAVAPAAPAAPAGTVDENSYVVGLLLGTQMHLQAGAKPSDFSMTAIQKGFIDALQGKVPTQAQSSQGTAYIQGIAQAVIAKNKQAATDFLAKNGKEKGVTTTASGLQYKVITPGNKAGRSPMVTDQVRVHYKGTFIDGTEFDSSASQPTGEVTFTVNGVIKGWTEALQLMKPGAKWQLFVPPALAYGDQFRPPKIAGGSLLVFDVELVEVLPPASPSGPAAPPGTPPPKN